VLVLVAAVAGIGAIDSAYVWKTRHVLRNAARQAAKIVVATPLNTTSCYDRTPCSVESAAAAAKRYLTNAGVRQASCINPQSPSFSGVLVWVFSCGGTSICDTRDRAFCLKIDMTPVMINKNGTLIPYTRVTVQCPHTWVAGSVLKMLPGRPVLQLPQSVSASVLLPDKTEILRV
jgi:hypothetical protein